MLRVLLRVLLYDADSVNFNPDDLRRQYEGMSDDALLEIDPADLTEQANQILEAELEARGLLEDAEAPPPPESQSIDTAETEVEAPADLSKEALVPIAKYTSPSEARLALSLLRSAGLASGLDPIPNSPEVNLVVPSSLVEQAQAVLNDEISEEELAAQAEAAGEELEETSDEEANEQDEK